MKALVFAALAAVGLTATAQAADLGTYQQTEMPGRMTVWTGPYIEGSIGVTSSDAELGIVGLGDIIQLGESGFVGGIGAGYDVMFAPGWVAGVLARVDFDTVEYKAFGADLADHSETYTIGGRLGFVPADDVMFYALVGYQFGDLDLSSTVGGGSVSRDGWVLGAGIETMLSEHFGIGAELSTAIMDDETVGGLVTVDQEEYTGKVRALWKF